VRISAASAIVFAALLVTSLQSSPTDPLTGMPFVRIEAGTFMMGTPPNEPQREAHEVQHRVTIARPFYSYLDVLAFIKTLDSRSA
jgi:formylglycine-generating enzyme required for sulfatase activity